MKVAYNAFTAGELSPKLAGRSDLPGLVKGCLRMRNFMPRVTGGAFRRPGTLYGWEVKSSAVVPRLAPFNFSASDALVLEFGNEVLRFGTAGALVGSPYEVATPWEEADLFDIRHVQINDVMFLAHPDHPPHRLTRVSNTEWELESLHDIIEEQDPADGFPWPAFRDGNATATTLTSSARTGTGVTITASDDVFESGHERAFFQIAHRRDTAYDELTIPVYPPAFEVMTITGLPSNGETFTINGRPYTWTTTSPPALPYTVLIPSAAEDVVAAMIAAINATASNTIYGPGTAPHPDVVASDGGTTNAATSATGFLTSNGNPDLTSGAPNFVVTIGTGADQRNYRIDPNPANYGSSATTCEVRQGATAEETLRNLMKAINLSGLGNGSDYHNNNGNFTVHPTVSAAIHSANQLKLTAKTGGTAGNSIPTTVSAWSGADLNRLKFSAATLTGGSAGASYKLRIDARDSGADGNDITVSEAQSNATWIGTSLTGGTDIDTESDGLEVLGGYKIWSYGTWKATVILERERSDGSWEALRQWRGNNDRNIVETGTADYPQKLRFRVTDASGTASSDVDIPRFLIEANDALSYGLVRVTNYVSATEVQADVVRALHSTDATAHWSEGAWSDYRGYPRAVAVHDQRLVFMSTANEPQTIWASATGDLINFRRGLNDSDGFSRQLAGDESSPILWAQSLGAGMVLGKESEEWLAVSSDGQASITPTNFQGKRQSTYGSAGVSPVVVGSRILFAQAGGRTLMEYRYAWDEQAFAAAELNELSDHLTISGLKQLAYSRKPESIVWAVTDDGKLLSMHYRREKEMIAWAYHPMSGTVESVAVVNGANNLDDVYIAVKRTVSGATRRYVERIDMNTLLELEDDDIDDADQRALLTYLDCAKRQTGSFTSGGSCTGLDHLEGELVRIYVDGSSHAQKRVSGGAVVLDRAGSTVLAGLDYADLSELVPFHSDAMLSDGTTQGRRFQIAEYALRLYRSTAGRYRDDYNGDAADLFALKLDAATDEVNAPTPVTTGVNRPCAAPRTQDEVRCQIKPTAGEPLNVLALVVKMQVTG